MKLIKSSYEILEQKSGLEGIYEAIERAGRTCYKSQRPKGQTAKDFVDRMIKSGHGSMLEHGTVYLLYSECCYNRKDRDFMRKYEENPYSKVVYIGCDDDLIESNRFRGDILGTDVVGNTLHAITTNMRVLQENGWLDDLKYLCEPTEFHEKRITVRFTTSNSIMREFTRHRTMSFAVESTRYCNYSKSRFDNSITFIQPYWFKHDCTGEYVNDLSVVAKTPKDNYTPEEKSFLLHLLGAEQEYMDLTNLGMKPQEAREVLPLATKCDMIMTGSISDWEHFFRLRTSILAETGMPHPDASALAEPLMHEFIKRNYING